MLEIYVQPDLNLADQEPKYAELGWIAATAIIGCLGLTYDKYPADQLKLHTQVPLDNEFMASITTVLFGVDGLLDMFTVSHQGSWIKVTKSDAGQVQNGLSVVK